MSNSDGSPELFRLIVERPNADLAIDIRDAFDRVLAAPLTVPLAEHCPTSVDVQDTSRGSQIELNVPRGLYVVRSTLGSETSEQVVRVSGETKIAAPNPAQATSAAYQGAASSHEYYSYPAAEHSRKPTTEALGKADFTNSWLFLFVRARDRQSYAESVKDLDGLDTAAAQSHLETPRGDVLWLLEHAEIHDDGWLAVSAAAPSGDYLLHDLSDPPRTIPIQLYPGWQTQLFFTFDRRLLPATQCEFFSRRERGFLPNDDWARAADLGLSVLVSGRGAVPADVRRVMLGEKFENPMLGLIAAWLALRDSNTPEELSGQVLANLDALLPDSPDVQVLRIAHARRYGGKLSLPPIRRTPLLQIAAGELIRAAAEQPWLLADENILDDVSARMYSDSAFTSWRPIEKELPAALRLAISERRLRIEMFNAPASLRRFDLAEMAADESNSEDTLMEKNPDAWLPEALAEVIEMQARRTRDSVADAPLDIAGMAKRTGVTPKAVKLGLSTTPLENRQIALSLSDTPSAEGLIEDAANQVVDATVYLARTLIAAGASLAYGGDFRKNGYTTLLVELIKTYNQTATRPPQSLHSYLGAPIPLGDFPAGWPLLLHHLVHSPDMARDAIVPPPTESERHPSSLYFSDMRRLMAKHTAARIILGGQTEPRTVAQGPGYGGRYPGIVEEAWRTLEAGQPLYVLGGFGGAAGLVADLLEGKPTPPRLQDATFAGSLLFQKNAADIDADPYREKLGLPRRMEDLAQQVCQFAQPRLASNEDSVAWNGLTLEENRRLWRTRDLTLLTSLVMRGLQTVMRGV